MNLAAQNSFDCSAYEAVPLPVEAVQAVTPKVSPSCASYRSYQGIGRPVNYSAARTCAWKERAAQLANLGQNPQAPTAWIVGGSLVLADLYVNGAGVERNLPLAMRFACEAEEGMAALASSELPLTQVDGKAFKRFEFCDYAATTITMNFCSWAASDLEENRRNSRYHRLQKLMAPDQAAVFGSLLAARSDYIRDHANEVDQGGTIRSMRTMGSQSILEELFRVDLTHFERQQWPELDATHVTGADATLRRVYNQKLDQLRHHSPDELEEGAVSAENLAIVQHAWELYRDAWTKFAQLRYPKAADAIRAKITLDRTRLIKTIY